MPFDSDHNASPFNALPPVTVALALALVGIELVLEMAQQGYIGGAAGVGWRLEALQRFAFSGPLVEWMLAQPGRFSFAILLRFVSYPFVQGGFTHMAFSVVFLLALGKFVGERFSGLALFLTWIGSAVIAALAFMLATSSQIPLYGGMPPAYGLVGAFTFLLWQRARRSGQNPVQAFQMIGFLVFIQIFFWLLQGGSTAYLIANSAGFVGGFGLSCGLAPGGWKDVRAFLRRR
jgi:membrane associated rhomboid family serine protease